MELKIIQLVLATLLAIGGVVYAQTNDVKPHPVITVQPTSAQFSAEFRIPCNATGRPAPVYSWYRNGSLLVASQTDNSYRLPTNTFAENGYYYCLATNPLGTAVSRTALIQKAFLNGFPNTNVEPYSVQAGRSYSMPCRNKPDSVPMSHYSWSRTDAGQGSSFPLTLDNRVQVDELKGEIYFANTIPADYDQAKPQYLCLAETVGVPFITKGSYSRLTVTTPASTLPFINPGFRSPAERLTVLEGDKLTMRCFFYGYPTPTISWQREGVAAPLAPTNYNTNYEIDSVEIADDGVTYRCNGVNTAADGSQYNFLITVDIVPTFDNGNATGDIQTNDVTAAVGQTVDFTCNPRAKPVATVAWFTNGKYLDTVSPPERYSVSADGTTLTIADVCLQCPGGGSDEMIVTCNATNTHGYAIKEGYLKVIVPTNFTSSPTDQNVPAGEDAKFSVSASADPFIVTPLNFTWLFNDTPIIANPNKIYTTCHQLSCDLIVLNVEESDGGLYICHVSDGVSEAESSAYLYILPAVAVFNAATIWYVWLIIGLLVLLLLLFLICFCYCKDNGGDEYPVDEIEKSNGNNPEKELRDTGLNEFNLPRGATPGPYQLWTIGGSQPGSKYGGGAGDGGSVRSAPAPLAPQLAFPPPPPVYLSQPQLYPGQGDYPDNDDAESFAVPVNNQRITAHPNGRPLSPRSPTGYQPQDPRGPWLGQQPPLPQPPQQQQQYWPDEEPEHDMPVFHYPGGQAYAIVERDVTPVPAFYGDNNARGVAYNSNQPLRLDPRAGYIVAGYPDGEYNGRGYPQYTSQRPPSESSV